MKTNLVRAALACAGTTAVAPAGGSDRRKPIRSLRTVIWAAAMILISSGHAFAGSITLPGGGLHSASVPLAVAWNGIGTPGGTVSIEVTGTGWSTISASVAQAVANTGQYSIAPPQLKQLLCTAIPLGMEVGLQPFPSSVPQPIGQITFHLRVVNPAHPNDAAQSADFKMTCPTPPGSLSVVKHVVNATGQSFSLPSSFPMSLRCYVPIQNLPRRSGAPISVPPNQSILISPLGAGTICSVTEDVLDPVTDAKGCPRGRAVWTTTYSPPVTIQPNATATITVTNTLTCAIRK